MDELRREFAAWAADQREDVARVSEEQERLQERRDELLIRAREAGMTNKQIGELLEDVHEEAHEEIDEDWVRGQYTPQRVTAMLRQADEIIEGNIAVFLRKTLDDDGLAEAEDDDEDEDDD